MPDRYPSRDSQGGNPYRNGPPPGSYTSRQGYTPRHYSSYSGNPYRPQFDSASPFAGLPDQSQQVLCDIYGRPLPNNHSYDVPAAPQERPDSYGQHTGSGDFRNSQDTSYHTDQPQSPDPAYTGGNANIETPLEAPPSYSQHDPSLTSQLPETSGIVPACECGVETCDYPELRVGVTSLADLAVVNETIRSHLYWTKAANDHNAGVQRMYPSRARTADHS